MILAGVVGWFDLGYFPQLSSMGYTCLSIEIGPMHTLPTEDTTNLATVDKTREIMDEAAKHNMVCDLLLTPHTFLMGKEEWPRDRRHRMRERTNTFMP